MATYFISGDELESRIRQDQAPATFAPVLKDGRAWLCPVEAEVSLEALSAPRSAQSAKGLLLPPTESMGQYGQQASSPEGEGAARRVLVGVRACELRATSYLDKVMLEGEFDDPSYRARRDTAVIVSCDCVAFAETCCCTLVGGQPFATDGYDVNLTPVDGGFVAEVATEAGRAWLGEAAAKEASPEQLSRRDEIRRSATQKVAEQNAEFTFSATDENGASLPDEAPEPWRPFAADCVECAACTNICPTCYCFYLYDQLLGPEEFERLRTWDSCLLSTYHRMAGTPGLKGTPRPNLASRLANRVLHKFVYSPRQNKMLGCVGCGRCIDACLGAIDIRQVVQELSK